MNLRLYIICIAVVLVLAGPALANNTATVHGEVYGWDTFKPLENAVVEVNSTPSQSMVAKYGMYSFDLVPGDYNITASYYQNSSVTYSANETIQIKDQGKYVLDLLLLPVYSEELMDNSEVNGYSEDQRGTAKSSSSNTTNSLTGTSTGLVTSNNSSRTNLANQLGAGSINTNYLLIAFLLLLLLATGYRFSRKKKTKNQPQKKADINEKAYTSGAFSKPVKLPEFSGEIHDKVEISHKSTVPKIKQESQVQESHVQEFQVKPTMEQPAADPVREAVRGPEKESWTEPVNELVKESVPEIPENKQQVEPAEIKEDTSTNENGLAEPEPQKEKREILFEESSDKPVEDPEIKTPTPLKELPLPADLQEVMDIIRGQGGRITQKDLRSRLKYSEGKVSLMLADLERRELIEKFKRGRGNVVILRDEER